MMAQEAQSVHDQVTKTTPPAAMVTHTGGCHCGSVRFEVRAQDRITAYNCNCTICYMKDNLHFIVPEIHFKLLQGQDSLTTYRFNTMKAQHTFCKVCGVQSFYKPRSNQDGYGVSPRCLDPGTVKQLTVVDFDGQNWEQTMDKELNREDGGIKQWSQQ